MEQPPGTISLNTMGSIVSRYFEIAFGRLGAEEARPSPKIWIRVLRELAESLHICSDNVSHQYPQELNSCPWCVLENQTSVRLFGIRITTTDQTGTIDVGVLWSAIKAVNDPGDDPALPSERPWSLPSDVELPDTTLKGFRKIISIGLVLTGIIACSSLAEDGGLLGAFILYGLACAVWPRVSSEELSAANQAYSAAKAEWDFALGKWKQEASRNTFSEEYKSLDMARIELVDQPNERRRRIKKLEIQRESLQRQRYLDRYRIDRASIDNIGSTRTSILSSYGIETASDVDYRKIIQIPGFGDFLTSQLVEWRKYHERNFRFNPNEPIDQREINELNRELEVRRKNLLSKLQQGPNNLKRISNKIVTARSRLIPVLEKAWNSYKIAEARRNAL